MKKYFLIAGLFLIVGCGNNNSAAPVALKDITGTYKLYTFNNVTSFNNGSGSFVKPQGELTITSDTLTQHITLGSDIWDMQANYTYYQSQNPLKGFAIVQRPGYDPINAYIDFSDNMLSISYQNNYNTAWIKTGQ